MLVAKVGNSFGRVQNDWGRWPKRSTKAHQLGTKPFLACNDRGKEDRQAQASTGERRQHAMSNDRGKEDRQAQASTGERRHTTHATHIGGGDW